MKNIENRVLSEEEIKRELSFVLDGCKKIICENTETYIVDDVKYIQIKKIYAAAEIFFKNTKIKNNKGGPFYRFGKILNFSEYPIIAYKTFLKHKYINITDPAKVKEQIVREYAIAKAEIKKKYKDLLEEHKDEIDQDFIDKINKEEADKLNEIESINTYIENNFEDLDIRITTFTEQTMYPHIRLIDVDGKEKIDFLRAEAPNIIYGHRNIFQIQDGYRKDAKHIKFVLEANNAFGEVYYKEK